MSDSLTMVSSFENNGSAQGRASVQFDSADDVGFEHDRQSSPTGEQESVDGERFDVFTVLLAMFFLVLTTQGTGTEHTCMGS